MRRAARAARCSPRRPSRAFTTNTAPSHTRSAASASATKLGSPGVSIRLILRSSQLERREARRDRHLARLLVGRRVRDRCSVCHRAEPVDRPASNSSASFRTSSRCLGGRPTPRCGSASAASWHARSPLLECRRGSDTPHAASRLLGQRRPAARDFSRSTAFVCSCETRDSVTPSTSPISRRVRFS